MPAQPCKCNTTHLQIQFTTPFDCICCACTITLQSMSINIVYLRYMTKNIQTLCLHWNLLKQALCECVCAHYKPRHIRGSPFSRATQSRTIQLSSARRLISFALLLAIYYIRTFERARWECMRLYAYVRASSHEAYRHKLFYLLLSIDWVQYIFHSDLLNYKYWFTYQLQLLFFS